MHNTAVIIALATVSFTGSPLWAQARADSARTHTHAAHHRHGLSDSAFAALQDRGRLFMGVDQYASEHRFDSLPDGGRIELQTAATDSAGVATIRRHLQEIAAAFRAGDFTTPAGVHAAEVPGTRVMAERRDHLTWTFARLPAGGEVRAVTRDARALAALHEFLAFQRLEHRAGGREH